LVGHAGAILLRRCADRTGLTRELNTVLPRGKGPGWWDRGTVLVCLATSIVLGATSMSDISLLAHQALVFADPPSEATVRRALAGLDTAMLGRIAKARAKVRTRVWDLLAHRPNGFPWLAVAGKLQHVVGDDGRPAWLPLRAAASSPSRVATQMFSRSVSARAKNPNSTRPGLVGS
jgi:hypothetical protein